MSRLRLPRYSMWTLFVVVTVLTVLLGWVAYNLNWIRQRHAVANRADGIAGSGGHSGMICDPPWPLGFFGEGGWEWVLLYFPDPERLQVVGSGPDNWDKGEALLTSKERIEFARVQRLFPEAHVDATYLPARERRH